MPKFGNRVKETTTTTGTATYNLGGAATGFQTFNDEFTNGDDEISYVCVDDPSAPTEWEYGKGTFSTGSPQTLTRDTIEGSSNAGAKVSWGAGTKTIVASPTAADFNIIGGDGPWGAKSAQTRAITTSGTLLAADDGKLILADGSGNSPPGLTITLLAAATAGDGYVVTIMNTGASGTVTVDGSGVEEINGQLTFDLTAQYGVLSLRTNGTAWYATPVRPGLLTGSGYPDADVDVDVGAVVGGLYIDTDTNDISICTDATANTAVWRHVNPPEAVAEHRALNTDGGTATSGSWIQLSGGTTNYNNITGFSVSALGGSIPAGKYIAEAWHTFYKTNAAAMKLYNASDTSDIQLGSQVRSASAESTTANATVSSEFVLTAAKTVRAYYQVQTTRATDGLGKDGGFTPGNIVYGQFKLRRIGNA